jgi:hypothetical protein
MTVHRWLGPVLRCALACAWCALPTLGAGVQDTQGDADAPTTATAQATSRVTPDTEPLTTSTQPLAPVPQPSAAPITIRPVQTPSTAPIVIRPVLKRQELTTATVAMPRTGVPTPAATPAPAHASPGVALTTRTTAVAIPPARSAATPTAEDEAQAKARAVAHAFVRALAAPADANALPLLRGLVLEYPEAPESGRALERIGQISESTGALKEAMLAYQAAALKLQDRAAARAAWIKTAALSQDLALFSQAATHWNDVRRQYPEADRSPFILYRHAMALSASGRWEEANTVWDQLFLLPADDPRQTFEGEGPAPGRYEMVLGRALSLELQGERGEARRLYERIANEAAGTAEAARARKRLLDLEGESRP